jgi:hypothetical protein
MITLISTALELQEFIQSQGWKFCFIGGLALQRWGEPRVTQDIDLTLLAGYRDEARFIAPLLGRYESRIPDAAAFALSHRVLLLRGKSGVGIDVALGGLPFEEEAVRRADFFEYAPGVKLLTASAEDLVIMKAFAGRPRDWADIQGIIIRSRGRLDWKHVRAHLEPLAGLKGEPEILDRLLKLRDELSQPPPESR